MTGDITLFELLRTHFDSFTPSEKRVARILLGDYPAAGLESVNALAARSNVSAPTVLRLLSKLGFRAYAHMQEQLRSELSMRRWSAIDEYRHSAQEAPAGDPDVAGLLERTADIMVEGTKTSLASVSHSDFAAVVKLLADSKRELWILGGRYSGLVAEYLSLHLRLLRKNVHFVGASESDRSLSALDLSSKSVVVGFDFRRYQESTVRFLAHAKDQKSTTVLISDPWLSPATRYADHQFSVSVKGSSPFDSIGPSIALVEAVITGVYEELGTVPQPRVERFDQLEKTLLAED